MRAIASKGSFIDIILMLGLFALFTITSLVLVVIGSRVYQNITDSMDDNYRLNTAVSYVANKARALDTAGDITLEELDGVRVLRMEQDIEGVRYQTLIYYYDGALRELFIDSAREAELSYGQSILTLSGFTIEQLDGGLYRCTAQIDSGERLSLCFSQRAGTQGE